MVQVKPLNDVLQKVAIEELGEVPSRIPEDLEYLKTWISQQPHLRARTDDQFLIQFLRGCKYSREKAKQKLDYYHYMRTTKKDLFQLTDVDNKKFRDFHNTGAILPLPTPLNDTGCRILMIRASFNAQDFLFSDGLRQIAALHEIALIDDPYACIQGLVYVFDFSNLTKDFLAHLSPLLLMNLFMMKERAVPLRLKGVFIINMPNFVEQFFKLLLTYMPEKLQKRIFVCGKNFDSFGEHLSLKYLPKEYGGENGCLDDLCKEYNKVWDEFREFFKQNAEFGTDEHLRMGEPLRCDDAEFGPGGSFRKVEVD
uniref:CRAL-TRIO domain-containing protein n=1 Tax=Stomoxys calcitrans TaxID=35570 RepID=A0A1I8P691_STOCA